MDFSKAIELITKKLSEWSKSSVELIPNFLLAALIVFIGLFIAKFIRKMTAKLFNKVSSNKALNNLFTSFVYILSVGAVIFIALSVLNLDKVVTSILAGAGILGLALAFAFQDIAANFMSGIFISFRKPIKVGDTVQIMDYMGKVEAITLRDTVIRTFQGQMVIIPNKEVFQNPIQNYSLLGMRRMDIEIGVSYGEDLERVKAITLAAVKDLPQMATDMETQFFFIAFGDSSINFSLRIWAESCEQAVYLETRSLAIIKIKQAYDANGIMIPFPIRTIDFGIKGGVTANEVLKTMKPT